MTPPGVITGRVFDRGKPAMRVFVRALRPRYSDGQRSLSVAASAETDDRGEYRLFGLEPGSYFVSAVPPGKARLDGAQQVTPAIPSNANGNQRAVSIPLAIDTLDPDVFDPNVYVAVYHPGTTDVSSAVALDVRAGETLAATDLRVARVLPRAVRGTVAVDAGSRSPGAVRVQVVPMFDGTNANVPAVETTTGAFMLPRVPPGRYVLAAQTTDRNSPRLGGVAEIEVGAGDVSGVTIRLGTPVVVTGHVRIDGRPVGATDPRTMVQLQVVANSGIAGTGAVPVQADGSFSIPPQGGALFPASYRVRVLQGGRTPWVRSIKYGSDDVTYASFRIEEFDRGRELEIDISTATATVEATVLDDQRRGVAGALVIAVPDEARRGRSTLFRAATTDGQGRARLEDMAPGEYRLFATVEIEAAAWQDPSVLKRLEARGELVRLAERGSLAATLRLVR
jgi:hypothetical protein